MIGVAYTWRALQKAFFSDAVPTTQELEAEHAHKFAAITWPEITGVVLLGASTLLIGLYPRILLAQIEPAVKALLAGGVQ